MTLEVIGCLLISQDLVVKLQVEKIHTQLQIQVVKNFIEIGISMKMSTLHC